MDRTTPHSPPTDLPDPQSLMDAGDARAILQLRLLIARAANKDSLHWWDDDAFAAPAQFILNRTFPGVPALAGRSLALRAAVARHRDACRDDALHLYRLDPDNHDRLVLEFWPLMEIPVPADPITSIDQLRQQLLTITGQPQPYEIGGSGANGGLSIHIPPAPPAVEPLRHRAATLAWAFLEGQPGRPVIPYTLE